VFYSCNLEKYNRYGFLQDRIFLVTNKHLFTLDYGPFNYNVHRKVTLDKIDGFTMSRDPKCDEILVHFTQDYDERYSCKQHKRNIKHVLLKILQVRKVTFKCY
jgi:hypothetical protein